MDFSLCSLWTFPIALAKVTERLKSEPHKFEYAISTLSNIVVNWLTILLQLRPKHREKPKKSMLSTVSSTDAPGHLSLDAWADPAPRKGVHLAQDPGKF